MMKAREFLLNVRNLNKTNISWLFSVLEIEVACTVVLLTAKVGHAELNLRDGVI